MISAIQCVRVTVRRQRRAVERRRVFVTSTVRRDTRHSSLSLSLSLCVCVHYGDSQKVDEKLTRVRAVQCDSAASATATWDRRQSVR